MPSVIPSFEGLTVLSGSEEGVCSIQDLRPLAPFDEGVCSMLAALSSEIMHMPEAREFPEVITFGFFCRSANIAAMAQRWREQIRGRIGRGIAFHIAPSNVPVNFAYSLVAGLLAGNANLVKASSRDFLQIRVICKAFDRILERAEHAHLRGHVQVVVYERTRNDLTEYFSSLCNARIIWGGDNTVNQVRQAAIPPRAKDICFADRYSIGIINARAVLDAGKIDGSDPGLKHLAQDFYNDTYLYDQNACTSQRLILWHGEKTECNLAQHLFWDAVYEYIVDRYDIEPVVIVDKLSAVCRTSFEVDGCEQAKTADNRIIRIMLPSLPIGLPNYRAAGGLFHERLCEEKELMHALEPLVAIINEKYQTLSYFGEDPAKLLEFVTQNRLRGIDRVVPFGHTADFDLIWDGYDLISELSRIVFAWH